MIQFDIGLELSRNDLNMKDDVSIQRKEGRPTKYIPTEIFPKIEGYLNSVNDTQLPSIEGLALYLDVNPDTIYEWAKLYTEFSETIKKIAAKQKKQLMEDGMYGGKEVNAAMAIFLLKVNHGMNEAPTNLQQINIGTDKGNAITFVNFKNESTS